MNANDSLILVEKYLFGGGSVKNWSHVAQLEYLNALLVKNAHTYQNQPLLGQKVEVDPANWSPAREHRYLPLTSVLFRPKLLTIYINLVPPYGLQTKLPIASVFRLVEIKARQIVFKTHFLFLRVIFVKLGLALAFRRNSQNLESPLALIYACKAKRLLRVVELLFGIVKVKRVLIDAQSVRIAIAGIFW